MKQKLTLSVDMELIRRAHGQGVNISRFLESCLKAYLEGNAQPQQTTPQLEQPNQTPKQTNINLADLFPETCIAKLKQLNIDINNNNLLKEIIQDCLQKVICELELYDPVELRYPTTTTYA